MSMLNENQECWDNDKELTGWDKDQEFEREWWGDCSNTFTEEIKQLSYGYKMGLTAYANYGKWPCYDLQGKSVLDIGGGPTSMLLKCENRGRSVVMDPCQYPNWVYHRYQNLGIEPLTIRGEDEITVSCICSDNEPQHRLCKAHEEIRFDEVWIYNVLQHTEDPEAIIQNAQSLSTTIRIFEWIDISAHEGHPQELKEDNLNKWLGGTGITEWLNENNCYGRAYYGVFNY